MIQGGETNPSPVSLTNLVELPLEQLAQIPIESVSGASRHEQKITQAPSSVSIVTAEEIKMFGHRTLSDVLQSVRGLYITYDRNYSYLGLRGFNRSGDYNSRVLLLVDGHRMNDTIYDQAAIGTEGFLDVDLIERVEIIRGPSSSIYGSSAFFGVVNVITKRGGQINGVEVSTEAGGFDTYKGRFTAGKLFTNEVEMLLSGSWYESAGPRWLYYPEFDDPTTNDGVARNSDGDRRQSLFGLLSWKDFTLSGGIANREKKVPTASYSTIFNSGLEKTIDQRGYADLKFQHDFSEDTRLMGKVSFDTYSYDGDYPYYITNFTLPGAPYHLVLNQDATLGEWVGTEWQFTQRILDRHTIVAGVDYRENLRQLQENYYAEPGHEDTAVHIEKLGRNLGLFSQMELALRTNLTVNAGARYDYYESFGGTVNPRLGLIYSPWQKSAFKLLYGQAFRAPNSYELYYESPGYNRANPGLLPENIRTYEVVYEQYLPASLRFTACGFYYDIDDLISQQEDALNQTYFENVGKARAQGVELELEHKSASGFLARASYVCQRAEDGSTGAELSNSPRHLAKLNLIAPVYQDKIFTGLEVLYTSRVRTLAGNKADDFAVANLTLYSQKIVKGLEVSASIYNLFDTHYGHPASADLWQDIVEQDGRSFRVKLSYRF